MRGQAGLRIGDSAMPITVQMNSRLTRLCRFASYIIHTLGKQVRKRANTASCTSVASCIVV